MLMHWKIKDMIPVENPNKETPIFMGHGDKDPLVKYDWGQKTATALESFGYKVEFKTYKYVTCGPRVHNVTKHSRKQRSSPFRGS